MLSISMLITSVLLAWTVPQLGKGTKFPTPHILTKSAKKRWLGFYLDAKRLDKVRWKWSHKFKKGQRPWMSFRLAKAKACIHVLLRRLEKNPLVAFSLTEMLTKVHPAIRDSQYFLLRRKYSAILNSTEETMKFLQSRKDIISDVKFEIDRHAGPNIGSNPSGSMGLSPKPVVGTPRFACALRGHVRNLLKVKADLNCQISLLKEENARLRREMKSGSIGVPKPSEVAHIGNLHSGHPLRGLEEKKDYYVDSAKGTDPFSDQGGALALPGFKLNPEDGRVAFFEILDLIQGGHYGKDSARLDALGESIFDQVGKSFAHLLNFAGFRKEKNREVDYTRLIEPGKGTKYPSDKLGLYGSALVILLRTLGIKDPGQSMGTSGHRISKAEQSYLRAMPEEYDDWGYPIEDGGDPYW